MSSTADIWRSIMDKCAPLLQKHKDQFDKLNKSLSKSSGAKGIHPSGSIILNDDMDYEEIQSNISSEIDEFNKSHNTLIKELREEVKRYVDENHIKNDFI